MWNLTIVTAHTYFVGDKQWLVHNACPNPNGIKGRPDHQAAVGDLQDELRQKWGNDYDVIDGQTLNTASNGQIPLNRKPDAFVRERVSGNIVEIGEAYRPSYRIAA